MALTKVSGGILDPGINVAGIVTATGFDGPFVGGSDGINAGVGTFTGLDVNGNGDISGNLVVDGNLTANGDFTTLNTTLREVEILHVDANSSEPAGIITQTGAGDILRLYDGTSQVVTVLDTGEVGIGTINPSSYGGAVKLALHSSGHTGLTLAAGTGSDSNIFFADGVSGDATYRGNIKYAHNGDSMRFSTAAEERLRINSDGKVGIGTDLTTSPSSTLTVAPHTSTSGRNISLYTSGSVGNKAGLFFNATPATGNLAEIQAEYKGTNQGELVLSTSMQKRLTINKDGEVGIGTDNPESLPLTVAASTAAIALVDTDRTNSNYYSAVWGDQAGNLHLVADYEGAAGSQFISARVGGTALSDEKLRITSAGAVGIGTNNPSATLTVDSGTTNTCATFQSSDTGAVINLTDSAARSSIEQNDTTLKIIADTDNSDDNSEIRFQVDASTKMRINSDGEVQIGTTNNPTADIKLLVSGNGGVSSGSYFSFRGDYGNVPEPAAYAIKFDSSATHLSAAGGLHQYAYGGIAFNLGGQDRVNFTTVGKVLIGHSSPTLVGVGNTYNMPLQVIGNSYDTSGIVAARYEAAATGPTLHFVKSRNATKGSQTIVQVDDTLGFIRWYGSDGTDTTNAAAMIGGYCDATPASNKIPGRLSFWTTENLTYPLERLRITSSGKSIFYKEIETPQDYPNFRPTLDLNFAAEKKLDPRITYSRTGPASFVNEFGKLIIVGDNAPRFDHNPITRECKGLLIEETRTNQWLYSEDLVTYVTGGEMQQSTLANTTATTDPTGGTNAVKMAATATGGAHSFYKYFSSGSNGDVHTASVWVKAAGVDYARLYVDTVGGNMGGPGVTFSTGNTWNVTASGTATQVTTSVVEYPNGWWRLSVSGSFSNQNAYYVHVDLEGGEGDVSFTGNGSNGMYVWGVQFELGSFPTSYIPTYGSTAARGYEAPTLEGTEFSDVFGTEFKEFSLVADYDNTQTNDGTSYATISLWGEANNYDDRIEWFKDDASPYHIETRSFGQGNPIFANGNLSASSKAKSQRFATSWYVPDYSNTSSRRFVVSMGGEAVDVINDSSGTTVPLITRMGIGCSPTRLDFSPGLVHFKRLMVYNKTLSDGQLQNLSA